MQYFEYYKRSRSFVTLCWNEKSVDLEQLTGAVFFSPFAHANLSRLNDSDGDIVAIVETWHLSHSEYADLLKRWPYPKKAHLFPKGWAEARRLCVEIYCEGEALLYVNRDSLTDELVAGKVIQPECCPPTVNL